MKFNAMLVSLCLFIPVLVCAGQKEEIRAWYYTELTKTEQDYGAAVRKAFRDGESYVASTEYTPRDAYDYENEIKTIVVARYGPLSQYAGLTEKERFFLLRDNLKAAYAAAKAAADRDGMDQALMDASDIKSLNDKAEKSDPQGGMSGVNFLSPSNAVPVYATYPSIVDQRGWTEWKAAISRKAYLKSCVQ